MARNADDAPEEAAVQYFYNIRTGKVEENNDERSRSADLMGPYDSPEEAQQALETARRRTEQWDEQEQDEVDEPGGANWDANPFNDA
ncbi:methionine aminopeptidase [Kytococcus aerolatus]|uniref:methionine aminopeptidase n=1 Tax=Kytococcus aerolatus TaxID=592308 RepID=UPI001F452380|nr:methionine aminopeptidase [Kytococcus aerolatus]